MTGDCHVRICEGRRVKLPPATRHSATAVDLVFYAAPLVFVDEARSNVAHRRRTPGRRLHGSSAESRSVK